MAADVAAFIGTLGDNSDPKAIDTPAGITAGQLIVGVVGHYWSNSAGGALTGTVAGYTQTNTAESSDGAGSARTVGHGIHRLATGDASDNISFDTTNPTPADYAMGASVRITGHAGVVDVQTASRGTGGGFTTITPAPVTLTGPGMVLVYIVDWSNQAAGSTMSGWTSVGTWDSGAGACFKLTGQAAGTITPPTVTLGGTTSSVVAITYAILDSVSFVAAGAGYTGAASATHALATPAGIADGDTLIAGFCANNTGITVTSPGWLTEYTHDFTGGTLVVLSHKVMDAGTEPGTHTFTFGSSQSTNGIIAAWRTANPADIVDVIGTPVDVSVGTSAVAPSVTTTSNGGAALAFCAVNSSTNVWGAAPWTNIAQLTGGQCFAMSYKLMPVAGATGTATFALDTKDASAVIIGLNFGPPPPIVVPLLGETSGTGGGNFGSGPYVSAGTVTPQANSKLWAVVHAEDFSGALTPANITLSGGGLTWNAELTWVGTAYNSMGGRLFSADVGGSPPSAFNTTVDYGAGAVYCYDIHVFATAPDLVVGTSGTNGASGTDGTSTVTMAASPGVGSITVGAVSRSFNGGQNGATTPGAGNIELYDTGDVGFSGIESQWRPSGSTNAVLTWDDLSTSGGALFVSSASVAFELTAGGGGPTSKLPLHVLNMFVPFVGRRP